MWGQSNQLSAGGSTSAIGYAERPKKQKQAGFEKEAVNKKALRKILVIAFNEKSAF